MADAADHIRDELAAVTEHLVEAREMIKGCADAVGDVSPWDLDALSTPLSRAQSSLTSLSIFLDQLRDSVNQAAILASATPDELHIVKLIADSSVALTVETLAEALHLDGPTAHRRMQRLFDARMVVNFDDGDGLILAVDASAYERLGLESE